MRTTKDAARRAADAVRKAADVAKRAAEAAQKKQAAAPKSAPKATTAASRQALATRAGDRPSASAVRQAFGADELSRGLGQALRQRAVSALGGPLPSAPTGVPLKLSDAPQPLSALLRRGFRTPDALDRANAVGQTSSTASPQATQAAAQVDEAYRSGGAEAAAKKLREVTTGVTPQVAADIAAAARPTVDKVLADLERASNAVDGSQGTANAASRAFDRTVADLSAALAVGASTPKGQAELDHAVGAITESIEKNGVGRFDEALGNSALGGDMREEGRVAFADTALATGVMEALVASGKSGEADDILQNVTQSQNILNHAVGELAGKVEAHNADLARLMQDWGAFAQSPEDLEAAVQAFKDSHPEYAQLEALGGASVRVADQLSQVPTTLASLGHADDLSRSLDTATDRLVDAASLTESGAAELARLQAEAAEPGAEPGLLDRITDLAKAGKKDLGYLQKLSTVLVNNAVSNALAASASGNAADLAKAVKSLERFAPVFGLDANSMESLTDALGDVAGAKTQAQAEAALDRLNRSVDNVKGEGVFAGTTGIGTAFRGAALVLSVGVTVGAFDNAIRNPSFESIVTAYSSAVGTGQAGVAFAKSFFESSSALSRAGNALKVAGTLGTVLTTGLNVFQAGKAFADGDPAAGALYLAQAGAGIAVMLGATGVGAVVGIGAALALAQLNKVRASNRFEDGHTEAFLQGLGLSPEATNHLRNADDNGRSVGPVFAEMAERLGVDPKAFLRAIGQLPPDQILALVEAAHGVDPNDAGEFRQTHETDAVAGTNPFVRPKSIQGLLEFMDNVGIDLGALPAA